MRNFTFINIIVFALFFYTEKSNAQIVIGKPNLGFSQACARPSFNGSPAFNTFDVTFTFSPDSSLDSSNQFIIELSDAVGNFDTPTILYTSDAGAVTVSPAMLSFPLPETVSGEAFKIRIKSTSPIATSAESDGFAAYYKLQDSPFSINNLISTAVYCSGGSYLLTIDNPGVGENDSPLKYPSLTYKWFKETGATTSVFVANGSSLPITEAGTYFVETNYGTCTSNSYSNRVTVSEATSETSSSISSSLGNPFCSSEGATTLSTISGISYQWFKDGEAILDATSQMYETNEAGTYSVNIDLGDCTTSATIDLDNTGFTSSIDVEDINMIDEGDTLTATVTTDANNPEFEWYLNELLINGANGNSYIANKIGNYKVIVKQTTGCIASTEILFIINNPFPDVANIPNLISPNGDNTNDTWVIPKQYTAGTNTEVMLISSQGKVVFKTNDYQNNWPENQLGFKDINPVYYYIITTQDKKTLKGSITVVK